MDQKTHAAPPSPPSPAPPVAVSEKEPSVSPKPKSESDPKNKKDIEDSIPYAWMLKPCEIYQLEYKDCKSIRDRFHQYFVHGELRDCNQWKADYDNCLEWKETQDPEALKSVISSEKERVKSRLRSHYSNDIWTNRTAPPDDWNKPLPEEIAQQYKGSFLEIKSNEVKEGKISLKDPAHAFAGTRCTIL